MSDTPPPPFPGTPRDPHDPAEPVRAEAGPGLPAVPEFSSPDSAAQVPPPPESRAESPSSPGQYAQPDPYAQAGQGNGSTQGPYAPNATQPPKRGNGLAITAIVLGGVALIGSFIPLVNYVAALIALVGLVLGIVALVRAKNGKGLALTGTLVSGVALILSVVLAIVYTVFTVGLFNTVNDAIESARPSIAAPTPGGSDTDEPGSTKPGAGSEDSDPVAIGTTVALNGLGGAKEWEVTLGTPTFNADAAVAAAKSFNEPAPEGRAYALLPVTLKYMGTETGIPATVAIKFVDADGASYRLIDAMATAPDPLNMLVSLSPGETATGNLAIAIPKTDVDKGTWHVTGLGGSEVSFAAK